MQTPFSIVRIHILRFMIVANKFELIDSDRLDFISEEMPYIMDKYEMGGQLISARTGNGLDRLDEGFMSIVDRYPAD